MKEKILFVDDDPNIINAFKRQLRKQFSLESAGSGQDGLKVLTSKGPFAVVVADMQMPEMDGITFLKRVQKESPQSIRLMLTGNADQQTAVDAVNEGEVFRFLTKPCPTELLVKTLEAALTQYHLLQAEKELLEGTLNGSIKLLTEVLSIVAPAVFERAVSLRETAVELARSLRITNTWDMEMATMLADIAYVTLPPETLEKSRSGRALSGAEKQIIMHLPETAHKLLQHIPRLESVARIVQYQGKNFDGSGIPRDSVSGADIPLESRILKVLHDFKTLEDNGLGAEQAMKKMRQYSDRFDPMVLKTAAWFLSSGEEETQQVMQLDATVSELRPGQVLMSNIVTVEGAMLMTAGHKLTATVIERLYNHHEIHKIKEPIQVIVPVK
ncbi:MAG: response regulator [gamma proteobacterium symbiont of Bathyaustriella thionipta]|nr:response regulator [gamma proteobacterium symbiont of Bathyaustriella thionipta]MCU7948792.1 response regulator [gamma proteobacterium symbiont of Bathyaustriella thionipta]MCU7954204.1 response regulator [gamma proteobacterium symbiont of Bathyaustriella thionipta]MCU7955250.1 response regulator [gamma proteobacterium symbiont of Bathyaustriella thionipta]MCU7966259.1 response regulator [gamma proteobacterium symbiont of Bathyaustriella thionipta]